MQNNDVDVTAILTFFRAPEKKDFPFFSCGATPPRTVPKTQPLQVAFSLRERVDLKFPERGDFGEENYVGKGGADRAKKGKRDVQKKVGIPAKLPDR